MKMLMYLGMSILLAVVLVYTFRALYDILAEEW